MGKLNKIHNFFVEEVAVNRNLSVAGVNKLATGEVFLGQEAIELNLIDELGGKEEAVNASKRLAGISEAELVKFAEKPNDQRSRVITNTSTKFLLPSTSII